MKKPSRAFSKTLPLLLKPAGKAEGHTQLGWHHHPAPAAHEAGPGLQAVYFCWICRLGICLACFRHHLGHHGLTTGSARTQQLNPTSRSRPIPRELTVP